VLLLSIYYNYRNSRLPVQYRYLPVPTPVPTTIPTPVQRTHAPDYPPFSNSRDNNVLSITPDEVDLLVDYKQTGKDNDHKV
jgi:hypothetical protein